jgi:L-fucose isomerase-like protein
LLRKSEDTFKEPNMDVDDVVVDDYGDVLWRLRALYGLKNTRGTKVAAIGGLQSYSAPGAKLGPTHAKEVWGFQIHVVPDKEVAERLRNARADAAAVREAERQAAELVAQPNVTLGTERRFVVNSFLALGVFKQILKETGAMNLGVANCMGSLIGLLDTPPCLVTSMLNDEGYTAFCHVDFTHTPAGVLLRWISGKPSFVNNSHFPHHGVITLAHCAAPRRMNGRDFEPTRILTHFESDYGAATKVEYTRGQVVTVIVPNLRCTKWQGFRGRVLEAPSYDMCRSQLDLAIDGDWRRLLRQMEGFHTVTCYGDYLREVGYALKKVKLGWENVSESA